MKAEVNREYKRLSNFSDISKMIMSSLCSKYGLGENRIDLLRATKALKVGDFFSKEAIANETVVSTYMASKPKKMIAIVRPTTLIIIADYSDVHSNTHEVVTQV